MRPAYIGESINELRLIQPGIIPQCIGCIHLVSIRICQAFPKGIPEAIWLNDVHHTSSYPGDHDIQFEKRSTD